MAPAGAGRGRKPRLLLLLAAFAALLPPFAAKAQEAAPTVPAVPRAAMQAGEAVPTLAPLVRRVAPSVVNIATRGRIAEQRNPLFNDPFFRRFFGVPDLPAEREVRAAGSGVIVNAARGLIITNHHVIEHAEEIAVTLADGRRLRARRLGADPDTDIALIQVEPEGLHELALGDSDRLEVGDFVVAIGNPFGLGQTVTLGIVSALGRTGLGIGGYEDFIQTDAPINPGNSGGALVNLRGELVGINTAIVGPAGGNVGIGFAIPANMVRVVMEQLLQFGDVQRGQLGIAVQDLTPDLARAMGLRERQRGAIVARVEPGSPAERAGLKAGDVITAIGKAGVRGAADLRNRIGLMRIGEVAELTVLRDGQTLTIRATIAAPPTRQLLRGADLSPLLDGAGFGPVPEGAPVKGVAVVALQPGSRAAEGGLRGGDIIVSVNRHPVSGPPEFASRVRESPRRLLLNVVRDGAALFLLLQ